MVLQFEGRLATGQDVLDGDLRALQLVASPGGAFLYAGTGRHGGLSVYEIASDAGAQLVDTVHFASLAGGIAKTQLDMLTVNGSNMLLIGSGNGGELLYYALDPDAGFGASGVAGIPVADIAVWAGSGTNHLYAIDQSTGILSAHEFSPAGVERTVLGTGSSETPPDGVVITSVVSEAEPILVVAEGGSASGLASYRVSFSDGTMIAVDQTGAAGGLGFSVPTAMGSVTAHGASWVIVAAAGSNTLSVLRVGVDGQLTPTDHVLDTADTRFGGVQALSVVKTGDHVLVFAGGADDGLVVFSLLPNGRLVHLQSIADAQGLGLGDVTAIEAGRIGDKIQVFVASEDLPGLSHFFWNVGTLGMVRADDTAWLQGTDEDDVLLAPAAGAATLAGGAGDDILVAGFGETVLRGGSGADIFVLSPSDAPMRIADFQPGTDRLDLSHFPMLRSPSQLLVTSLPDGVQLDVWLSRIIVSSASGTPLDLFDLWGSGRFSGPDRLLTEAIPVPLMLLGTEAADILSGGGGEDTIRAAAGDDVVSGGSGADSLDGGLGHDEIWAGSGDDLVIGDWGRDTIGTGEGADSIDGGGGGDLVWSGPGNDTISGGGGPDALWAIDGEDVVWGGDGDDTLGAGRGNDDVTGGTGHDVIYGGRR